MRYQVTTYEWNEKDQAHVVARTKTVTADRVEVEGHMVRFYRRHATGLPEKETLMYATRDWDEIELVEEAS